MRSVLAYLFISIIIFVPVVTAGWQADLTTLLQTPSAAEREMLSENITLANPSWQEIKYHLDSLIYPSVPTDSFYLDSIESIDGVTRPYVYYVPPDYDSSKKTPLLVYLHGGVGRANIIEDPINYARESEFIPLAEMYGWLMLFPLGQDGATWWDDVGMSNIDSQIITMKKRFNIDDNRVFMEGFSDGGSAAFLHAMLKPNMYGAFIALNGHMGVGSTAGDLPLYAPNMFNTPVYAITSKGDQLYPSEKMRPTIEMARSAGANIIYREYEGGHDFVYGEKELPFIFDFMNRHPRDPFPPEIAWETTDKKFGKCRWLSVGEITAEPAAEWHKDYNTTLVNTRIIIGFVDDDTYEGDGIKIGTVVEDPNALANKVDLQKNDILIKADDFDLENIDQLNEFKATVSRGDEVTLTVVREGDTLTLTGRLPEEEKYLIFQRTKPSAKIKATLLANHVDIKASRLGALKIYIHPAPFNFDDNLVVTVNGEKVYDEPIEVDLNYMLQNFLLNRDRELLYVNEVTIEL